MPYRIQQAQLKRMKVIFLTEAGSMYGYGHLMRCIALTEGFKERAIDSAFVVRGDGEFSEILKGYEYKQVEWLKLDNVDEFIIKDDIAIVDSYYPDEDLCRFIYINYKNVIFFDDYNRLRYPGGIVLNGVIGAENINYPIVNGVEYLLGTKYQPLRKEFWEIQGYAVRETIGQVMITFGGSDITNETPFYVDKVRKKYPESLISIIIGKGFCNIKEIEMLADSRIELIYSPSAQEMVNIMVKSDLAVSAAGQTISELARIGVPTIGVQVAENQKNNIKFWHKAGFLIPEENLGKDFSKMERKKYSDVGRSLVDGQGVRRVVEKMVC